MMEGAGDGAWTDPEMEALASYLPSMVLEHAARLRPDADSFAVRPEREEFDGAVLFVDISGFTKLSSALVQSKTEQIRRTRTVLMTPGPSRAAPRGVSVSAESLAAEELRDVLNEYFGLLIEVIYAWGGDMMRIAGDGLIAVFRDPQVVLPALVLRACSCSLEVIDRLHALDVRGQTMHLHCAISAGPLRLYQLGGVYNHFQYVVDGEPLGLLEPALSAAGQGDVVVAEGTWPCIRETAEGSLLPSGHVVVSGLRSWRSGAGGGAAQGSDRLALQAHVCADHRSEVSALITSFVPRYLTHDFSMDDVQRSPVTQALIENVASLNLATVLFMGLHGIKRDAAEGEVADDDEFSRAQSAFIVLQTSVFEYEGTIKEFTVDDKGCVVVALFGLPPYTHDDDAARAVEAAEAIIRRLHRLGIECSIGISTGQLFTGSLGSASINRREFCIVGDAMITAARLMGKAEGSILCDSTTTMAASSRFEFCDSVPVQLKGREGLHQASRPRTKRSTSLTSAAEGGFMTGRTAEQIFLKSFLQTIQRRRIQGGTAVIEGPPGIGKTHLMEHAIDRFVNYSATSTTSRPASGRAMKFLRGSGVRPVSHVDRKAQRTPFRAWVSVLEQCLGLDAVSANERTEHAGEWIAENIPDLTRLGSLLNSVLGVVLPESPEVQAMDETEMIVAMLQLAVRILKAMSVEHCVCIVMDNALWLDDASWALVQVVNAAMVDERQNENLAKQLFCTPSKPAQSGSSPALGVMLPVILVLLTRPIRDHAHDQLSLEIKEAWNNIVKARSTCHLKLESFQLAETQELLQRTLECDSVETSLCLAIHQAADANPLYIIETAKSLAQNRHVTTSTEPGEGGRDVSVCRAFGGFDPAQDITVPYSLAAGISNRLLSLSVSQQVALKSASVIGESFSLAVLVAVFPNHDKNDKTDLRMEVMWHVTKLEAAGFMRRESSDVLGDFMYAFASKNTWRVVYATVPFSQRSRLHHQAALAFEDLCQSFGGSKPFCDQLVYHFTMAGMDTKAALYLKRWSPGKNGLLLAAQNMSPMLEQDKSESLNQLLATWSKRSKSTRKRGGGTILRIPLDEESAPTSATRKDPRNSPLNLLSPRRRLRSNLTKPTTLRLESFLDEDEPEEEAPLPSPLAAPEHFDADTAGICAVESAGGEADEDEPLIARMPRRRQIRFHSRASAADSPQSADSQVRPLGESDGAIATAAAKRGTVGHCSLASWERLYASGQRINPSSLVMPGLLGAVQAFRTEPQQQSVRKPSPIPSERPVPRLMQPPSGRRRGSIDRSRIELPEDSFFGADDALAELMSPGLFSPLDQATPFDRAPPMSALRFTLNTLATPARLNFSPGSTASATSSRLSTPASSRASQASSMRSGGSVRSIRTIGSSTRGSGRRLVLDSGGSARGLIRSRTAGSKMQQFASPHELARAAPASNSGEQGRPATSPRPLCVSKRTPLAVINGISPAVAAANSKTPRPAAPSPLS